MTRRVHIVLAAAFTALVAVVGIVGARAADDAFAEPSSEYQLMVSDHPDLSDARLLHGAEVSGDIYVFVAGPDGEPLDGVTLSMPVVFGDVAPRSAHREAINRLAAEGITQGCGASRYCPGRPVSRGQMATFLGRALDLRTAASDRFTDDTSSPHEAMINRVAARGITQGCQRDRFCPTQPVTRAQMASFLARARGVQPTGADPHHFADVSAMHPHGMAIAALADQGVIAGFGDGTFRPQQPVSRAQMASFLVRAFGI